MDRLAGKISFFSVAATIYLSSGMITHVLVMPVMLETANKDAWISVLFAAPFFILWFLLLCHFMKRLNGKPFIVWVKEKWGRVGKFIIIVLCCIVLFFNAVITLVDTMLWTVSTYLQQTPFYVLSFVFICACIFLAFSGLQSIASVASILFPLVSLLGFFIASANGPNKDYSLLLPMLEHGLHPVINGMWLAFIALCDCWILLLFSHHFKSQPKISTQIVFCLFFILLFVGPLVGGITEFGAVEAGDQRYTVFDQWKLMTIGRFLEHVDFLSIYQWLSGALIRISISLYLVTKLVSNKSELRKTISFVVLSLLLFGISLFKWRTDVTLQLLKSYYLPSGLIIVPSVTLLIIITQLISPNKNEKKRIKKKGDNASESSS